MTSYQGNEEEDAPTLGPPPSGSWENRVEYDGVTAYRPNELIVTGNGSRSGVEGFVRRLLPGARVDLIPLRPGDDADEWLLRTDGDLDVTYAARELRQFGLQAEPNHVLFSHNGRSACCGQCVACAGPHANPVYASPVYASPVYASPVYASPVYASPVYASPVYASEYRATGVRASSARPASKPRLRPITLPPVERRALILDTGMAEPTSLPEILDRAPHSGVDPVDHDIADKAGDGFLDPANGHGTFIAGIIEMLAPGTDIESAGVLGTFGEGDVARITARLYSLIAGGRVNKATVINLSFGGYADTEMKALGRAIRHAQLAGAVVVASAGNDGVCQPTYPASFPDVVSVGSIEPTGRASYSNFGNWVRACAPGTDLVSSFFQGFNGDMPMPIEPGASDPDSFEGWARWTGTSFAAPVVVAALLRHMALTQQTAKEAMAQIIDAPGLYRYPGLGTVVNLAPGV